MQLKQVDGSFYFNSMRFLIICVETFWLLSSTFMKKDFFLSEKMMQIIFSELKLPQNMAFDTQTISLRLLIEQKVE